MRTRAILIANHGHAARPGGALVPGCLDALVDRPIVEHVIEQLAVAQVEEIDIVTGAGGREIETRLDGGERWGVRLRYHAARHPAAVYEALSRLPGLAEAPDVILAHADVLVPAESLRPQGNGPTMYHHLMATRDGERLEWTGWCRGSGRLFAGLGVLKNRAELGAALAAAAGATPGQNCDALFLRDARELLAATRRVLTGRARFLSLHGQPRGDWIWRERAVKVHPTARLRGPVYLGEHVEVGEQVELGPNVVVGEASILDRGAKARECVIAPETYVAPGTRCERVVGLGSRGYCDADGEPLSRTLARELVDLNALSTLEALYTGLVWLVGLGLAPLVSLFSMLFVSPPDDTDEMLPAGPR